MHLYKGFILALTVVVLHAATAFAPRINQDTSGTNTITANYGTAPSVASTNFNFKGQVTGNSFVSTNDFTSGSTNVVAALAGKLTSPVDLSTASASGTLAAARMPALTGDVTTSAGAVATTMKNTGTAGTYTKITFDAQGRETSGATADLSGADVTGILAAGRFPALTGDVTTSSGALATTIANNAVTTVKINAAAVTEAKLGLTDVTTANVSITAHGLAPKGDNVASHYLDGTGVYSTPAGGGGASDNWVALGTTNSTLSGVASANSEVITNSLTIGSGIAALWTLPLGGNMTNAGTNVALTNDIPYIFNSNVTMNGSVTLPANVVTSANLRQGVARSVIGVTGNATANEADIQGTANQALVVNSAGTALAFGAVNVASSVAVTGALPFANGGSGQTTANAALDAFNQTAEASVVSATTTDLGAQASQMVQITGTTPITGFGTVAAGTTRWVRFAGALTLTHNGTSLILPNAGNNITTAAGDRLKARSLGSGNWFVYDYVKADGTALVSGGTTINATGGPLFASTADQTVANTTTETTLIGSGVGTKTLSANYLVAGKTITAVVRGRMGSKAVSPGSLTIKVKLGSTVIWSGAVTPAASLANDYMEVKADITCRTTGASGTVFGQATLFFNDGVTTAVNAPDGANTATSTIDTTATQAVDVTATWATADANNTITGSIGIISDGTGGSVTDSGGALTSNAIVLGAGNNDTKVVAGITTDGVNKITATTFDLGNTDTTIARASAGDISVEGNLVYRAGGTDVPVADGGTGLSSGTSGGVPYFSGTTTIASSAALAANALVVGGGAGAAPSTVTTGTGVLTALAANANASGGFITSAGTVSSAWAGGGNTVVGRRYLPLQFTRVAATSMIVNTNDPTLASYGRVRFPGNSTATNSNYAIYRAVVPIKFVGSSGQDLTVEKLTVKTTGTQTGAFTFNVGVLDIADSAAADPTDSTSFANYVAVTGATLTSPVANDRFSKANVTLTGWRSALTAGDDMAICVVRNDTNTDSLDLIDLLISYVESQ